VHVTLRLTIPCISLEKGAKIGIVISRFYCIAITTSLYFPVAIESQSRVAGAFGADARSFLLMGDWRSHCGRRAISSNLLLNFKLLQAPSRQYQQTLEPPLSVASQLNTYSIIECWNVVLHDAVRCVHCRG
jgi:hypothetical protein